MRPQGVRLPWQDVPAHVRDEVAMVLGSPIVAAHNQPGGFSPGVAARAELADGRRCFVKAVGPDLNPDSPAFHRAEGRVAAALPSGLPVPRLWAVVDDGAWVVLVFEEVEGHPPATPWSIPDLAATFGALDVLAMATTPCPVPHLAAVDERFADLFRGWRSWAGGDADPGVLGPEVRDVVDRLADLEAGWAGAATGHALLHADLRADNLLVRADGTVSIVDWPHACVGAPFVDKVFMLPSVGLDGGPSPADVEAALDPFDDVAPEAVDRVIAAFAGSLLFQGHQPDPPGLPTLRAFQRAQGDVALRWLTARGALGR